MSKPGNATVESSQRNWARKELELSKGSQSTEQLLQRLTEQEFVLSDSQREALHILVDRPHVRQSRWGPRCTAYEIAKRKEIDSKIESFAAEFFQLSPQARQERWARLRKLKGLTPPQELRLEELRAGLTVKIPEAEQHGGMLIQHELVKVVCDLFVSRRSARAQLRAAFLKRIHRNDHRWSDAAKRIARHFPSVAGLVPAFVDDLASLEKDNRMSAVRLNERRRALNPIFEDTVPADPPPTDSGASWGWILYVSIAVVIGFARFAFNASNTPSSAPPNFDPATYQQKYIVPDPGNLNGPSKTFPRMRDPELEKIMKDAGLSPDTQHDVDRTLQRIRARRKKQSFEPTPQP